MAPKSVLLAAAAGLFAGASASVPWAKLDKDLGGRLQKSVPLERPCFREYNGHSKPMNSAACEAIQANYTANDLRINTPEAYMSLTNQLCISNPADQCILDSTKTPAGLPADVSVCRQGNVPSYHVEVKSAKDVKAAFAFAKKHDIEISVKNSGHDFMVRSSGKGTLTLWTHNLQGMEYHADFTPEGCGNSVGAAMTVMAGVPVLDAYDFADEHDSLILGPYAPSVAMAVGWVSGGGHSVFSPVYGLGADRVVQFDIVTPDGKHRIANEEQNADLFWALRGGGGGTFGVVLSSTHRVEPRAPVAYADIHLPENLTTTNALDWVELLLEDSVAWGEAGWGGHVGGSFVTHFNPLEEATADNGTAARAAFKRASDFALALGGTSNIEVAPSFSALYNKYNAPVGHNNGGRISFVSSRLMPRSVFESKEGRESVIEYMRTAMDLGFDPRTMYTPVTTPYVYKGAEKKKDYGTSMTQAWYDAVWHFETSGGFAYDSTYEERLGFLTNLTQVTINAEKLMGSNGGAYLNEANPFTLDWKDAYWGTENYEKLLDIKNKYDPDRLLNCWKCVGFDEDADAELERFSCNAKIQADLNKSFS